jgi:TonB family protein
MIRTRLALAAALVTQPLAASAQPQPQAQPPSPAAPSPWQVDWGQYYCSLIRQPGEGRPYAAAFLTVPGSDGSTLMLLPEGEAPLPDGVTSLLLVPSGRSFPVTAAPERRGIRYVLTLRDLPYEFRTELGGATEVQLLAGTEVRLRIPVDRSRAAIAAHRRCTAEISREWRVDEAGLLALQTWPNTTNLLGYRPEDYPPAALRAATQGRAMMRITVTTEGHAADCAVVATSGDPALDQRSCRVVMLRARFRPARDAAGERVRIPAIYSVTWRTPQRP